MKNFIAALLFAVLSLEGAAQTIIEAEYFIDTDAGIGKNNLMNVVLSADADFSFTANFSGVSTGNHKLFIRTKDSNGKWSLTETRNIQVLKTDSKNIITEGEYFFDNDPGFGSGAGIAVTANDSIVMQNFTALAAGLQPGVHKLYKRFKDSQGNWSQTIARSIEVVATDANKTILSGEYFFDSDPGFAAAIPIAISPQDSAVMQNFTGAASGLQPGFHKLYIRLKDVYGKWGQTARQNVQVLRNIGTSDVVMAEYFFTTDAGIGNCAYAAFSNPSPDGTFSFNIPSGQIPSDADTLFIRVKDSGENNWSLTQWKVETIVLPLTLISFNAIYQNNTAQLNWVTTNEVNTAYFNIQRSTDATRFSTVGKVLAKGANLANNNYYYADNISHIQGGKIFYRLEQADNDGKISYSKIVSIDNINKSQLNITPNPAKDFFTIASNGSIETGNAILLVTDIAGQTVIKQRLISASSQNINTSRLSKGIYILKIIASGAIHTQKLLVQ